MDERDSHCPYLLSSETTAKGTGLAESAGKEDPVELDSFAYMQTPHQMWWFGWKQCLNSGNEHRRPWGWLPDVSAHGFRADPCDIFHNLSKKSNILLQHMCWRGSEGFRLDSGTSTPPDSTFGEVLKMTFKNGKPHQGSWGWVTDVSPNSFHADPYDIFHNLSKKIKKLFVTTYADEEAKGFAFAPASRLHLTAHLVKS